jgi:hypothetical protein
MPDPGAHMNGSQTALRFLSRRVGPVALMAIVLAGCGGQSSPDQGEEPTKSAPSPTPTPNAAAIPDDFPLAQGLVADGDTRVTAPRRDVKGVSLQPKCWGGAWPGAAVDRLVVQQVGPELGVTRELAVYPDAATAEAVAEQVRVRAARCHRLPAASDGPAMDVTVERTPGADPTVSFAETLTGGQPGGSVFVFTQVGRAILAVEDSGEWTRDSAVAGARDEERHGRALVARLCVFRDAGC